MLSITNHVGVLVLLLVFYFICSCHTDYDNQRRTGKRKGQIKITSKAKWEGIQAGTALFCILEILYWFVMYFFILN